MRHPLIRLAGATVAAGVLTGLGGVGYYFISLWLVGTLFGRADLSVAIVPAVGFCLAGIVLQAFPATQTGGIREVIASLRKPKEPVPLVRGANVLLSCMVLGFGGSAGSEGPVAQLGGLIGSRFAHLFRLDAADIQTIVRAAVAAGTAALFRSPVGGIVLTVELFGARLDWGMLPIAAASALGFLVRIAIRGNEYPLQPPGVFDRLPLFTLLVVLPAMGVLGAFVGRLFLWAFERSKTVLPKAWPLWLRVSIGGTLVGCIGIWFPQVLSGGYPVIRRSLDGGIPWVFFWVLCAMKILSTSITFGSGAVGGVFAPVFVIGGLFGGAVGYGIHAFAPWAVPQGGLFVMIGAMVVFGCVIKCKWTGLIIFADLSGSYVDLLLPALIAGGVAHLLSRRLNPRSIYAD
jgi:CIC family chloride channel protein